MLVDNWARAKLGVYGGGVLRGAPTPRIDKFASEDPARLTSKSGARHGTPHQTHRAEPNATYQQIASNNEQHMGRSADFGR
jgi:hypothetical protein